MSILPVDGPQPVAAWRLRRRTLEYRGHPLLMGIVNVTPDSFSDGGRYIEPEAAVEHGLALAEAGADLLDIGGESTRPYADRVDPDVELRRTVQVVDQLARQCSTPISIDTSKAVVAEAAVDAGAEVINDVTALTADPAMLPLAVRTGVGVCAMHMQGTPQTMQDGPRYDDVVREVIDYLAARRDALEQGGLARDQICLDPGIGFGKTHLHNLTLMNHCWQLHELGCTVLVGHSRKGFLAKILDDSQRDRTAATIGGALALARQGVQVIRVHDIGPVGDALKTFSVCGGM